MGSSIYHVGWQPTYYNVPTEVRILSDAYNECRRLALGRLLEEARACRADAVLGVRIDQGAHDWAPGAIEFIAIGTAVRLPERLRGDGGETLLCDLSGQEFTMLCQAGTRPVGIAAHTSVHYVPASPQTQMAQGGFGASWVNQELVDFSQGVYEAREKAIGSITAQVRELGGDGIIGVEISEHSRTHAVRRGMYESTDLEVTFHVMGTVIREDETLAAELRNPTPDDPLAALSDRANLQSRKGPTPWPMTRAAPREYPRPARHASAEPLRPVHLRPVRQRVPARQAGGLRAFGARDRQLDLPHRLSAGPVEAEPGDERPLAGHVRGAGARDDADGGGGRPAGRRRDRRRAPDDRPL